MIEPNNGVLLVSDPFLKDPNFIRTVVFLCEHTNKGSLGFVLNRPYEQTLDLFVPELEGFMIPVYYGGPVQPDTLHFLHVVPDLIPGGQEVADGIFWGGDFPIIIELIRQQRLDWDSIRFFLGYSGWSEGQLEGEIGEKSWLTVMGHQDLVFHDDPGAIWRDAIHEMDDKYHPIVHYPIDPQLN
jgi:putative transcriptional regulator